MSKRKHPTSNEIVNPTIVDSTNYREKAKRLKKERDVWENKQTFEVIRPDSKTVIYRRIPNTIQTALLNKQGRKFINQSEIHKGRI